MTQEHLMQVHLNLGGLEARNVVVHLLAADPSAPVEGLFWYNTTSHVLRYYNGTAVVDVTPPSSLDAEAVQDIVGAMVAGNTETRITVTYDDTAGVLNFVVDDLVTNHVALADPHAQYQKESEKGAANGYASLDGGGTVPDAQIPGGIARDAEVDAAYQDRSSKGVAGGYASLDGGGRVPASQLPVSAMEYKGTWNATTNTPALADGTGSTGDLYRVSTAGTRNLGSGNITFDVGDYVIYNGATWEKGDTTDAVSSVFGRTGAVVAAAGDYTASQVTNVPHGNVAGTDVQTAINEIADEYPAADAAHVAAADPHAQYVRIVEFNCAAAQSNDYTHNFGSRTVDVTVYRATAPYDEVECGVEHKDANNVTVYFAVAPAAGDFKIVVLG